MFHFILQLLLEIFVFLINSYQVTFDVNTEIYVSLSLELCNLNAGTPVTETV